jgi:two-component system sensor histidine kinase DesK
VTSSARRPSTRRDRSRLVALRPRSGDLGDGLAGPAFPFGAPVEAALGSPAGPAEEELLLRQAKWASGWRQVFFPSVFLLYLGQVAHGLSLHAEGFAAVVGYLILAGFATCFVRALRARFGDPMDGYWWYVGGMVVLLLAEIPLAHEDAFAMVTFIVVLTVAPLGRRALPYVVALVLLVTFLPAAIPSWHTGVDTDTGLTIALVSLAMYGFFEIVKSNRALSEARAEVARLATESERSRIARDLHDLLGHSLTTITVKARLAGRLADVDTDRAAAEIREVEELSRRALADVRAAISSYRDVTLTGELASGRELLRAAGIEAALPASAEQVRPELHELFGWVVREGLTNVVRHSRATRCEVAVSASSIEIRDDGLGTMGGSGVPGSGSGLAGLRERVADAGGRLEVGAGPKGAGWHLRVTVDPVAAVDADGGAA